MSFSRYFVPLFKKETTNADGKILLIMIKILFYSLSIQSNLIEKFDGGYREEIDKSYVLFSY